MAQIESEQRKRQSEIRLALNPADHDKVRAMLDDAGYDLVLTYPNSVIDPGTMYVIDMAHMLPLEREWFPDWGPNQEGGGPDVEAPPKQHFRFKESLLRLFRND